MPTPNVTCLFSEIINFYLQKQKKQKIPVRVLLARASYDKKLKLILDHLVKRRLIFFFCLLFFFKNGYTYVQGFI